MKREANTMNICHQKSATVELKPPGDSGKMMETTIITVGMMIDINMAMMVIVPDGRGPNHNHAAHTTNQVIEVRSK